MALSLLTRPSQKLQAVQFEMRLLFNSARRDLDGTLLGSLIYKDQDEVSKYASY